MIKACLYMRCSTREQTIDSQRPIIEDYCLRNNLEIVKTYIDLGVSGTKDSRPELDKMLNDMRQKHFEVVVCFKLDRLGRSLKNLINLLGEFKNRGVRLVAVSDGLDTRNDNPMTKIFWQLLGMFGELERDFIVSRVRAGLEFAKKNGKQLGRPKDSKDRRARVKSGYFLRYHGKTKEERRLGPRKIVPL